MITKNIFPEANMKVVCFSLSLLALVAPSASCTRSQHNSSVTHVSAQANATKEGDALGDEGVLLRFPDSLDSDGKEVIRKRFDLNLGNCVSTNTYIARVPSDTIGQLKDLPGLQIIAPLSFEGYETDVGRRPVVSPRYARVKDATPVGRYLLRLGAYQFDPLASVPLLPQGLCAEQPQEDRSPHVIQFRHIPTEEERQALGLTFERYVPDLAYVEELTPSEVKKLRASEIVRWIDFLHPAYKIDLNLTQTADGLIDEDVWIWHSPGTKLDVGFGLEPRAKVAVDNFVITEARVVDYGTLIRVAELPVVFRIERKGRANLRNATTSWVIQTNLDQNRRIHRAGLRGNGQVIGLIDDFVDRGHCFFPSGKFVSYNPPSSSASMHGTFVAGILVGENNGEPSDVRSGQAPMAKLAFRWWRDATGMGGGPSDFYGTLVTLFGQGARIFSNSWGDDSASNYTRWAYEADLFSWQNEDALILFAVKNDGTVASPENAKNVLAVGASGQANTQEMIGRSASGPTQDPNHKRRKPEIFAPGCVIRSAKVGTECEREESQYENACSTSWASPAVAGAAAIVRQYFMEGWYPTGSKGGSAALLPTGSLIKSVLLNATVDMPGEAGYPSDREGWGRLLLDDGLFFDINGLIDSRRTMIQDVRIAQGLNQAQRREFNLTVRDSTQPLKITLVWADPPPDASVMNDPVVNNLDLVLRRSSDGVRYFGNNFDASTGVSQPGTGPVDSVNNVEQIVVNNPSTGTYTLAVEGTTVARGPQGFALVVSGGIQ